MDPSVAVDAVWGAVGATANLGVVFVEACRRVKGWPWARPYGPGGGVYAVTIIVNVAVAGMTTAAVASGRIEQSGLIAFGMGAAAPVVVKKMARYVEALLPSGDQDDPPGRKGDADDS
jgi:hypothetical protein